MTSTLRYPATVTPASSLHARLLTEAGRIALQYTPPLQGMVHELLETVIPILIAAATDTTVSTDRATARIRVLTAQIAGSPAGIEPVARKINDLTSHLLHIVMTDDDPALRTVARTVSTAGNKLVADLLTGAQNAAEQVVRRSRTKGKSQRAHELLNGEAVVSGSDYDLAPAYAVVAVHSAAQRDVAEMVAAFELAAGDGALTALTANGGYALLPAEDEARALQLAGQALAGLPGKLWMSVAWRARREIVLGRREAAKILSLVIASEHQPGVYRIDDVLVEYAIARDPSVSDNLVQIIAPLLRHSSLLETLKTLIATDGNRSQAADRLIVHRSTLDYRIQRIEHLTGLRPGSVRGINVLSAALTAHAMAEQAERSQTPR